MEIFLGGTCNGSDWRERLKPLLTVDYFDPVVSDWNEEAQRREIEKRKTCDLIVYVITPRMTGVYTVAEAVDDSNKRPERTVFCVLPIDSDLAFDEGQMKSLRAVADMIQRNGGIVCADLAEVAAFVNQRAKGQ